MLTAADRTAPSTLATVKPAVTYTVYYRTGGRDNCKWVKVLERYESQETAQDKCRELGRAGYKALYEQTDRLERMGLPEGWEA